MHLYVVTGLVVILSSVSLILVAIGGLKQKTNKPLSISAIICLGFMLAGAIGVNAVPTDLFGIAERLSVYSAVVFNAILGLYGFTQC